MSAGQTSRRRWIASENVGVRFNLSDRLVKLCVWRFKNRARNLFAKAVREERLIRPDTCFQCGATGRIEGHHPDYTHALNVVWLRRPCHKEQPNGLVERLPLDFVREWVAKHWREADESHARRSGVRSTIGSRIAGYRRMVNRTSKEVAEGIGMNEAVLLLWESDQAVPTLREAIWLARELKVSLDYIFEGRGAP